MKGLAFLFGFYWIGTLIQQFFDIPLPGNVIGLALFTVALFMKWVKLEWVEDSAQFLLKHMTIFFAPIIVGTIAFIPLLIENGMPIVLSLVFSTLITLWVTGWIIQIGSKSEKKKEQQHESN